MSDDDKAVPARTGDLVITYLDHGVQEFRTIYEDTEITIKDGVLLVKDSSRITGWPLGAIRRYDITDAERAQELRERRRWKAAGMPSDGPPLAT